ncbi:RING-10 protein [Mytilinidion resinicola]|uniref:RING-10 protein n=1 Tax=Mytilinidion resinicola TaxID=574789 RepID=A0A6A6YXB9_9PEZI|nr:RING-10 protein [Mytilinidion resinicola]KAF2812567.1 RING-10 protein [Mytilinidion resinicola]
MPSYFFHLAFELYPYPTGRAQQPSTTSLQPVYTPPLGTDIFTSELPVHRVSSWGSAPSRPSHRRSKTATSSSDLPPLSTSQARPLAQRRLSHLNGHSSGDHRESPVPLVKPASSGTRTQHPASQDWRFGSVSIQSIDMSAVTNGGDNRPRGKSLNHTTHVGASSGGLATKGKFVPSDPKNTEVGWGVVHLYRDGQETPDLYDDTTSNTGPEGVGAGGGSDGRAFTEEDCTTLCILAVPSYMTPSDLLGFVGEQTREDVSHFRLIRTGRTNKYMVLMKFREAQKAKQWRKEWNGKLFNSMEPENCHVVFVKSIEFQTADSNRDPSSFPNMNNDPFTPAATPQPTAPLPVTVSSPVETSPLASSLTTKPLAPPTPSLVELPTCPVCLERMDETTGLLTILCQHVFHCACLEKWRGSGCPVCRYTQNDALIGRGHGDGEAPENECSVCGSTSNLWICLICGSTGCGRYDSAHAFAHYEATSHSYAMDVVTQHVWDYAGDGYVHRLIQNKADGKLVDLPASSLRHPYLPGDSNTMTGYATDTVPREKLDNMGTEYAYLLTSQLESQRAYFEEQVERAADKAAKAASAADEASHTASALSQQFSALSSKYDEAQASIKSLERDSARHAARATSAQELARKLTKQYQEEKTINESLMTRISFLESKVTEAETKVKDIEKEKSDLEEQNRDLSFFISGQEKLKEMQENEVLGLQDGEVEAGKMELGPGKDEEKKGRRKGKGKQRV